MRLIRDGSVLVEFTGRTYNNRPETEPFDQSVDQQFFRVIAPVEDFLGSPDVKPVKFDQIVDVRRGETYTVQTTHIAGADEDEVLRIVVKGGQA